MRINWSPTLSASVIVPENLEVAPVQATDLLSQTNATAKFRS